MPLILIALLLAVIAVALLLRGGKRQSDEGLPVGKVIYDDSSRRAGEEVKPLYSARLGLSGKPDYIVRHQGLPVPVEVKSRRAPRQPYDSHIYQLAAYCLLIEEVMHQRPPYGIIRYNDRSFQIDYTPALEAALDDLLAEMRQLKVSLTPPRSHDVPARCAACGYREECGERLG
jgi:CRISPR-associated exonuclease Cas4